MTQYLLFSALLLVQTPGGLQPGTGIVTGVIRVSGGGPASGIRVGAVAIDDEAASALISVAETDASGRFRLTNIPEGRYHIVAGRIAAPTYFPGGSDRRAATEVLVEAARVSGGIDFSVPPGSSRQLVTSSTISDSLAYKNAVETSNVDVRLRLFQEFERRYPRSAYLHEVYAAMMEIYTGKRMAAEATAYGDKALKLNPHNAAVLLQFSRLHALVKGDFGTALDFAEKAVAAAAKMKSLPPRQPLFTARTWPSWVATVEKNTQSHLAWVKEQVAWQRQVIFSNMIRKR